MKKKILSWILSGALLASTLAVLPMANLTANNAAVTPITANAAAMRSVTCKNWDEVKKAIENCTTNETLEITLSGNMEARKQIEIDDPCTIIFKTENATIKDLVDKPLFYLDDDNINLQFKNVTFYGQEGKDSKRAIYVNDEECSIQYGTFQNYLSSEGGAIYVNDERCTISDATFKNCSAKEDGGAIYLNGDKCVVKDCTFSGTSAPNGSGGAVFVDNSDCKILNSTFTDCKAANGGAIYMNEEGEIVDCTFEKTSATNGGAIYDNNKYGGDVAITRCTFTDCKKTTGSGNWVYGNNDARAVDCTMGSEADYYGMQSIQNKNTVMTFDVANYMQLKSVFDHLSAGETVIINVLNDIYTEETIEVEEDGCIIKFQSGAANGKNVTFIPKDEKQFRFMEVNAEHVTLDFTKTVQLYFYYDITPGNATDIGGGGILVDGDYCTIKNGLFNACCSNSLGGAINVSRVNDCTIENSTFYNCRSFNSRGGAIAFETTSERGVVKGCTFTNNQCVNTVYYGKKSTSYCFGDDVSGFGDTKVIDCKSNSKRYDHYYSCDVTPCETYEFHAKDAEQLKAALDTEGCGSIIKNIVLDATEIAVDEKIYMASAKEINFKLGKGIAKCLLKSINDDNPLFYGKASYKITFADGITLTSRNNSGDGGAIYFYSSLYKRVTIEGGYFLDCYAKGDGGAIYFGSEATLIGATFKNCEAGVDGGAILLNDDATVQDCKFDRNGCGDDGGSIYDGNHVGDVFIINCEFSSGYCGDVGVWVDCNGDAHISGCTPGNSKFYNSPASIDNYNVGSIFSEGNALILFIVAEAATIAITALVTLNVMKKKSK